MTHRPAPGSIRIMTYSHDGYGLGHLRRNLRLASGLLGRLPDASILAATGSRVAHQFRFPPGVDYLKLPSITKQADDVYVADGLHVAANDVSELRAGILDAAVHHYQPDLILVDRYPLGVGGELEPALARMRNGQSPSRLVLGLRDILDEPSIVKNEWERKGYVEAIEEFYDQVLVYGCANVYDSASEYGWPETVTDRVTMTGYLTGASVGTTSQPDQFWSERGLGAGPVAVCTSGGGMDGGPIAWAFLDAMAPLTRDGWSGLLVTGPFLDAGERLNLEAAGRPLGVRVEAFLPDLASYLDAADVVVSMAGYNTMCDILDLGLRSVVIPRVIPRREQVIRASLFAERGVLDLILPDRLTAASLRTAMVARASVARADIRAQVAALFDLNGLDRAASTIAAILALDDIPEKASEPAS